MTVVKGTRVKRVSGGLYSREGQWRERLKPTAPDTRLPRGVDVSKYIHTRWPHQSFLVIAFHDFQSFTLCRAVLHYHKFYSIFAFEGGSTYIV